MNLCTESVSLQLVEVFCSPMQNLHHLLLTLTPGSKSEDDKQVNAQLQLFRGMTK